jgi:hypothetical protein
MQKGRTWMARVGLSDDIDGKGADGGDSDIVCRVFGKGGHGGWKGRRVLTEN